MGELGHFFLWVVLFIIASEIGFRVGLAQESGAAEKRREVIGSLQAAAFGLLGLLLAFTFSMALSRLELRKQLVLKESRAIEDVYIRANLTPEPQRGLIKELLREYVDIRLDFYNAGIDKDKIALSEQKALMIRVEIGNQIRALVERDPHLVVLGLLVSSYGDIFEADEARMDAYCDRIPDAVLYLVVIVAMVCFGFVGYQSGLSGRRALAAISWVVLVVVLVLVVTLDIDRPRRGLIKVSQGNMIDLKARLDLAIP